MPFQYKKIVVVGATSVGRRKEKLDALAATKGPKVEGHQFDITNLDEISNFVASLTKAHPDVDCVLLNSGMQRKSDFGNPNEIDIDLINLEFVTNYLSYLGLTKAFLPFLMAKKTETGLIFVSSALGLVPIPRVSNYCATKAALHHWILCLREQLKPFPIKVIEVYPPAVQTELHDEKHQPDIKNGRSMGMPLDEFTDEAYDGLAQGLEQVPVQHAKNAFEGFEVKRQEIFEQMMKRFMGQK